MPRYRVYHTYERTDVYEVEAMDEKDAINAWVEDPGECLDKIDGREFGVEAEEVA